MSESVFGVDIGNGFAYVSVLEQEKDDPRPMIGDPYNSTGGIPTDAYVHARDIGARGISILNVQSKILGNPGRGVHAVKIHFANGETATLAERGRRFEISTDDLYTAVARDVLQTANKYRESLKLKPIYQVVLTYPAVFQKNPTLLARVKNCVERISAGGGKTYKVVTMFPEPAAAALDYLHYMKHIVSEKKRITKDAYTVLVYDLGEGTFDVALVTIKDQQKGAVGADLSDLYTVHHSDGIDDLGGRNFTEAIINSYLSELNQTHQFSLRNPNQREALRQLAVNSKHALTEHEDSEELFNADGQYLPLTMSRESFEALTAPLLDQTLAKTSQMLAFAKKNNIPVDAIVLTGGASRMPMIGASLREMVKDDGIPVVPHRASNAVSFGAARLGFLVLPEQGESGPPSGGSGAGGGSGVAGGSGAAGASQPSSTVEQQAQFAHGISRPSETGYGSTVRMLVPSTSVLPAVSQPIELEADSDGVLRVRVWHFGERGQNPADADPRECWQLFQFPFDLSEPGKRCRVRFTLQKDGNISCEVLSDSGEVLQEQNVFDKRKNWIGGNAQ